MRPSISERQGCPATPPEVEIQDGVLRLYVVGPVHGALNALRALDGVISCDVAKHRPGEAAVLHAGGYIDKGDQVPQLLSYLIDRAHLGSARVTYLLGAHEWLMLRALTGDRRAALEWLLSGAEASLDGWGVPARNWVERLPSAIPKSHMAFVNELPACAVIGGTRFACSSFAVGPARPFGLIARPGPIDELFGGEPATAIGSFSDLLRGAAPEPWVVRDVWTADRISCAVLDRLVS